MHDIDEVVEPFEDEEAAANRRGLMPDYGQFSIG
jgi:hypothetical protein